MATYLFTITFLTLLVATTVFAAVRQAVKGRVESNQVGLPPRKGDQFVDMALSNQRFFVILILGLWYFESPQLTSFGIGGTTIPALPAFIVGIVIYVIFIGVYTFLLRLFGLEERLNVDSYIALRSIWPRSVRGRSRLLVVLLVNPFTEELIYRGFLVFYLGHLFDSKLLFSVVGLIACLAIHIYQGVRVLHFHALFCVASIFIVFSPLGLVGCFGFHLAGDVYPFTRMKYLIGAWKTALRNKRLNAA